MFDSVITQEPADAANMPGALRLNPDGDGNADRLEEARNRHAVLIQCLKDEGDLQAEERLQMAIDEDYYDHLQWRYEDALVLMDRGQAPLVFNESRQTIDWVLGMQKRMRTDYKILPRTQEDEKAAEAKTKVFKYVSDVNLAPWHESRAFKQAALSGLGWLEEGINTNPSEERIFAGSEDWKNILRDSRDLGFDQKASRYLFRKKRTDLDYAIALLPHARQHLTSQANDAADFVKIGDDAWYLGERLTGATDLTGNTGLSISGQFRDRSAYIGGDRRWDIGRRLAVDLVEAWYRVPERVKVFARGPLAGKEFNAKDTGHDQLAADGWAMYEAVVMRMRVMICTEDAPLWDGKSPFKHQEFGLIPVWGYRRGRDGMCYGLMRGMRDLNDDINKRASKALHAASSNRVVIEKNAVDDIEKARTEAARPDMFLTVKDLNKIRFEKPVQDMQANLEMLTLNREMLRNVGGVTQANLGQDSRAVSGKAIGLQQDQGGLTTSELPDNLRLARIMAGRRRLSHIEQFMTEPKVIRILGNAQPIEWLPINQPQEDGSLLNDITNSEADFIIGETNYRESYAQAAMESMMELLGKVGTFAPQVVLTVLDLVVESAEITNREEWVARIRKLNGQRDPNKRPTPEEEQADQQKAAMEQRQQAIQIETMQAGLDKLRKEVEKLDTEALLKRVESMFSALQAAQIVALTPGVAPVADTIAAGAGFKDQAGEDPAIPAVPPAAAALAQQTPPVTGQPQSPLEGVQGGIETPTGADNGPND